MEEIWRDIEGYEGIYQVSNLGEIKSLKRLKYIRGYYQPVHEKILKPHKNKNGYYHIRLSVDKEKKIFKIHRLVACAFIPNPENKPCVNHIDGVKNNNNIKNLEWVTQSENSIHAVVNNLKKIPVRPIRKVRCIETNIIYDGMAIASRATGTPLYCICGACINPKRKAFGFHWEYVGEK